MSPNDKETLDQATTVVINEEAAFMTRLIKCANYAKNLTSVIFFKICLEEERKRLFPEDDS